MRKKARFPHLYRCGHIEARSAPRAVPQSRADFRIFIDAATLKHAAAGRKSAVSARDFRIFIDAATLKLIPRNPIQRRCRNFRIFIDAATLKPGISECTRTAQ